MTDLQKEVKKILALHKQQIQGVDTSLPINKIVKNIDKISFETQNSLYKLLDIRQKQSISSEKKGHCC